ncbi:MAG: nitrate reductase [Synechocystis sp.]|nr:nitrate reductase [Synechocystis sp.]
MSDVNKTLCPYCGVGCGLDAAPAKGPDQWRISGDRQHPSSQGMVCVKGATVAESLGKDRLIYPYFRRCLTDKFERISWEQAYEILTDKIQATIQSLGVDGVCMYGSGQLQTEDYYVAQKLLKGCLGTNNFDTNSRLCMSSAVSAYKLSLGSDGPPCCYDDLDLTDCAFVIGTNTAECHPIIFNRLNKHIKKNAESKLIVVDPRRTKTAEAATLHLAITPGTDITLLNGMGYLLWQWGKIDKEFIQTATNDFESYLALLKDYPPENVAKICGITQSELETAATYWAESKNVLSLWSMGLNQSSEGTAKICSLINLHLLTGQISKPGAGPFSLTGQPNAMGGRETGGLASLLPGYRSVTQDGDRRAVEQFWGIPEGRIADQPGLTAWEMILGLEQGQVGVYWVAATNPAVSLPDLNRVKAALQNSLFTVVQDAYYPTETAKFAHLLLPAAQWSEKTGTMTNSERRVTLCQQFRPPMGEAKADWEIFAEVGRRLGFTDQFPFQTAADVYREFSQLTGDRLCDLSGLTHQILDDFGPQQWPFPAGSQPTTESKRLYLDRQFSTGNQRATFQPFHSHGLAEPPDPDYPFILTTGRLYGHWHTQTRTGRIDKITKMHPQAFLEIHPRDAERLQITELDWIEVRSRRGLAQLPAKITPAIRPGTVFVPMHWGFLWGQATEANALTHPEACPLSGEPELKACAVQLSRLEPPLLRT